MRKAFAALVGAVGADEAVLVCGLAAVTAGVWAVLGAAALAVPGAVLVWVSVPSRRPFIDRVPPKAPRE